jgi:hypothetical protein
MDPLHENEFDPISKPQCFPDQDYLQSFDFSAFGTKEAVPLNAEEG